MERSSEFNSADPRHVDGLIRDWQSGRKTTADQIFSTLYPELRRLAAARMRRERDGHSWQPTLLVNELYLELLKNNALNSSIKGEEQRRAFLSLAGFLMKRLLILHSRPLKQRVTETSDDQLGELAASNPTPEDLSFIDQLLNQIQELDPRLRTVVELKVFEGQSHEEIAERLGCSVRSVGSYWSFARQWLEKHLAERSA